MADYLHLEDLTPGDSWKSPARTLLESDIGAFAGLTGDFDPLHTDFEHAANTPYGRPIAHGLLGLSFMAGLSSTCPRVRTLAFVRIEDWQFQRPMFAGDTVCVETTVEAISPKGRKSGEVLWTRKLINQRGECVQSGRIVTLVSARHFLPRRDILPTSNIEGFRKAPLPEKAVDN
jgi:acyl dehydratase